MASGGLARSLNLLEPEENAVEDCDVYEYKRYKARLNTYIEGQKWVRRPLMLAPSVCAQYGWKCISNQLLECEVCSAKLSAGQPRVESYQAYRICVENTRKGLETAHKKRCPWPIIPCPISYVKMIPIHKEVALKEFKRRFESLVMLETSLPQIKEGTLQMLGFTDEVCSALYKLLHVEPLSWSQCALTLAATGWKREFEGKQKMSLSCDSCQRVVSLLLYMSVQSLSNGSSQDTSEDRLSPDATSPCDKSDVPKISETGPVESKEQNEKEVEPSSECLETPAKKARFSKEPLADFDPLFEHRPWCLWVIASEVRESTSICDEFCAPSTTCMPGWKLFVKCLLRNTGCSDSPMSSVSPLKEQLNIARNMLESWNTQHFSK